jgi:hypothetical protein
VRIVVLEQVPSGYSIDDYKNDGRDICLVVGNEVG